MMEGSQKSEILFEADTPLGFAVRVTRNYWEFIVSIKHPSMANREKEVSDVLKHPDEIRQSLTDPSVFLFYKKVRPDKWVCAIAKRLNKVGFLITTYPTDSIKEGGRIWQK